MISPVFAEIVGSWPSALQLRADVGGAAVLPDDGAVHGLPGGAVPDHGGLALVGDADRGDVLCAEARLLQRLAAGRRSSRSRCPRARARPSRRPENAAGIPAAPRPRSRCRRETRWRARRWCPDRWRGRRDMGLLPGRRFSTCQRQRIGGGRSSCVRRRPSPPMSSPRKRGPITTDAFVGPSCGSSSLHTDVGGYGSRVAPTSLPGTTGGYAAAVVTPPSTTMVWPVMKVEASEAR